MDHRPKTLFCDIDGTLIVHRDPTKIACSTAQLLDGTLDALREWDRLGYNIILTTGRKESLRAKTEKELSEVGVIYDQLVMGLGGGDRILINDKKPCGRNTAWTITLSRDEGLKNTNYENLSTIVAQYFEAWGKKDIKTVSSLFSDSIMLKDWNISCVGKENVVAANAQIFNDVEDLDVEINCISHIDNKIIADITVKANQDSIPVIDIIEFDQQAKIKSITAYRGN